MSLWLAWNSTPYEGLRDFRIQGFHFYVFYEKNDPKDPWVPRLRTYLDMVAFLNVLWLGMQLTQLVMAPQTKIKKMWHFFHSYIFHEADSNAVDIMPIWCLGSSDNVIVVGFVFHIMVLSIWVQVFVFNTIQSAPQPHSDCQAKATSTPHWISSSPLN